jgi:hypothetical protein
MGAAKQVSDEAVSANDDIAPANDQRLIRDFYTTKEAAVFLNTTPAAVHMHVQRGNLKPDSRGGRGRFKGHRFSLATLVAFNSR